MKIQVTRELTTAEAGDIAITAAEGGIGYWAVIDSYDWTRWSGNLDWTHPENDTLDNRDVPEDFVFYTIREVGFEDDASTQHDITPHLIARGVQLYLTGAPRGSHGVAWPAGRVFDDMDDLAVMDAAEADVVIQLGCFGELVFG